MSGYQEVLTDPSYKGQIVTMTYPHIGNYGINEEDWESGKVWVEGFVAREFSRVASNFRSTSGLDEYLKKHGILAIDDIDTRALTRKLRLTGSMNGVLSTVELDDAKLAAKAKAIPKMSGLDLVKVVTSDKPRHWKEFVTLTPTEAAPAHTGWQGEIFTRQVLGTSILYDVRSDSDHVRSVTGSQDQLERGSSVAINFAWQHAFFFDRQTEERIQVSSSGTGGRSQDAFA